MRFNTKVVPSMTENNAGGQAYEQSPKLQLASLLISSFASDNYYEKAPDRFTRLDSLIKAEPLFAAQAMIYARTVHGMRSITHVGAAILAKYASGQSWLKDFYNKIVYRPDDMMEILAAYMIFNNQTKVKMPNAMRRGFRIALGRFDKYQLAKYRADKAKIKLIDIVNLCRPKLTNKNEDAIQLLVQGKLISTDTWESMLSAAGNEISAKQAVWHKLLSENKLGYFALLRNLRNILEQTPDAVPMACEALINEQSIKKSLVLPFRYLSAFIELNKFTADNKDARLLINAISDAVEIATNNLSEMTGNNLVVLDKSGSMYTDYNANSKIAPIYTGALFASVLANKSNADVIVFGDTAKYVSVNKHKQIMISTAELIENPMGGTDYHKWINLMNKQYDRIFVLSDGEAWRGYIKAEASMKKYRQAYSADPLVYNFDLAGNGTMQFPERRTACIAGFSDKTLELVTLMEKGETSLVKEIELISLN